METLLCQQPGKMDMSFFFDPSLNCFFNALLREWQDWRYIAVSEYDRATHEYELTGSGWNYPAKTRHSIYPSGWFEISAATRKLSIPCRQFSTTGRHQLLGPCVLSTIAGDVQEEVQPLSLPEAIRWVMLESGITDGLDEALVQPFITRAIQSDDNLRDALDYRQRDLDALFNQPLNFVQAESALLTGHSIHPCPKARDHFSKQDAQAYSPEYQGEFELQWYLLKRANLYVRHADDITYEQLLADLIRQDKRMQFWAKQVEADEVLFPCHPFQHKVWQKTPRIQTLIKAGTLVHLGQGSVPWSATSSVRAIYNAQTAWMLKFSLSVKLTNSLRHLQPAELVRGAELCRVLDTPPAQDYRHRFPDFSILMEPLAAAICDENGKPFEETIVLWRENPFSRGNEGNTEVLATLLQDSPVTGVSRLQIRLRQLPGLYVSNAREWFRRYLITTVRPLLIGQADYGLLFGAHQQNIVLTLDQGMPAKMAFRDCQGTGFTQLASDLYRPYLPAMAQDSGNLIEDGMAISLFSYYLIINATFNVISSLCQGNLIAESVLVGELRSFLQHIKAVGVKDSSCIDYLLTAPELSAKGNFFVALRQLNENTETDYLAMYHPLANPLTGSLETAPRLMETEVASTKQSFSGEEMAKLLS